MAAARAPRKDPKPREVAGMVPRVVNANPKLHYVLAYANDMQTGVPYYEQLGYQFVTRDNSPDAPRLSVGTTVKEGEIIEFRGHKLMAIDREELAAIRAPQMDISNRVEEKIYDRKKSAPFDPEKGSARMSSRHFGFRDESSHHGGVTSNEAEI